MMPRTATARRAPAGRIAPEMNNCLPELRDWLRAAGFTAVATCGQDGQPLTAESRRMIVVGGI